MTDNGIPEAEHPISVTQKGTSFGIDVLKLASGTTIAQALGVVSAPLLTRLYDPSAYGVQSIFVSVITILTVISCLRYEYAIMLPKSDEEAGNLMAGSILIAMVVALVTVPFVWLGKNTITQAFNVPELAPFLWLIPPTVFLGGISVGHPSLNFWATRMKHFTWLSVSRMIGATSMIGYQLTAGLFGFTTGGHLILGNILGGGVVSTLFLAGKVWKKDGRLLRKSIRWSEILTGLKRHYKFPLFDSWGALLNTISWQLPTFFLANYFSTSVVGYYALGNYLLRIPMSVIGNSISQVFFQRSSEAKISGTLDRVVEVTFSYLVKVGFFPLLLLTIIGKDLFVVVLGNRWAEAGVYTQILSVWTFFWFISTPLSNLFRLLEKQEFSLGINIIIIVTRVISLIIGGIMGNPRMALLLFSVTGILVYGYLSVAIMRSSGVSLLRMISILLKNILIFLPVGGLLVFLWMLGLNSYGMVGLSAIFLVIYYVVLVKSDPNIYGMVARLFHSHSPGIH